MVVAPDELLHLFCTQLDRLGPFGTSPVLAVAVSGGSDSLALTLLAHRWAVSQQGTIIALTVDHGLRPESAKEAAHIHDLLSHLGIEHHILPWQGDKPTSNIQSLAREARYRLLTHWCRTHQVGHLLLGHQQNDQAETLLLRLFRGSGSFGASGMGKSTQLNQVRIIRPLLDFSRGQLRHYLQQRGIAWIDDPSNENDKYGRIAIRNLLGHLPDSSLTIKRLADFCTHMERNRSFIEQEMAKACNNYVTIYPPGYAVVQLDMFHALHEEIVLRVCAMLLTSLSGSEYPPRLESLQAWLKHLSDHPTKTYTLHGCMLRHYRGHIFMYREWNRSEPNPALLNAGEPCLWDGRFHITYTTQAPDSAPCTVLPVGRTPGADMPLTLPTNASHPISTSIAHGIILGLPAIIALEKLVAIPHIGYYADTDWQSRIDTYFLPRSPLNGASFIE